MTARRTFGLALAPLLAMLLAAPAARAGGVPDWLAAAAARDLPPGADRAPAALLHDEQLVQVPARGRIVTTTRFAVRVLQRTGTPYAACFAPYVRGSSEVRELHAWTLAASGGVLRTWSRHDAADVSDLADTQLYTEQRHLQVSDPDVKPGETWACEVVSEEEPLFASWLWRFRGSLPSAWSRFALELPAGLEPSVFAANADSVLARHEGQRWSWEANRLAALPDEPLAPQWVTLGATLGVQVIGPAGGRTPAGTAFRDWPDLAAWIAALSDAPGALTPELAARAHAAAGGSPDTLARIRALARFVQKLNYVSRDRRLGVGWGYRPHDAAAVLAAGYGDCKDKANLLRTLLVAEGVDAWLLPVYSRAREHVDSAWVSPQQFDHCITALRAPASYRGPLLDGGRRGRLVAFDPTDPITAFGDLPADEQGALALLVRAEGGGLVRLPVVPPQANHLGRRVDAVLDVNGRLEARLVERTVGQAAVLEIAARRARGEREYRQLLEGWLPAQGGVVQLANVRTSEDSAAGGFALELEFVSPAFARVVGGRMLTFRTALTNPRDTWVPADTARALPIALAARCLDDTLSVRLPAGLAVDERPDDVHLAGDLGELAAAWSVQGDRLVVTRHWEVRPVTVPASRWRDVRSLYAAWRDSNAATVVLVPK